MECNLQFNRKGEKVDNLSNAKFSRNNIHGVVGYDFAVDGNILDLTDIFCHYVALKLVPIKMDVYWDKTQLVDIQ